MTKQKTKKVLSEWLKDMHDWRSIEDLEVKASVLTCMVETIIMSHSGRLSEVRDAISQYDQREYSSSLSSTTSGLNGMGLVTLSKNQYQYKEDYAIAINLLRSCVNTLLSKVSKYAILPRIATVGADYHIKEKAKKADRFLRGMFRKLKVREFTTKALLQSSLYGYGFVKVCVEGNKLELASVNPDEVFVDYADAHYNSPSTMYQIKLTNITEMIASYPEKADELRALNITKTQSDRSSTYSNSAVSRTSQDTTLRNIIVSEVWDLPYGDKKGYHAIFCGNVMLFEEEWLVDYFPIIKLEYVPPISGYYPRGLAHEIGTIQEEHDRVTKRLAMAQDLISAPKILMRKGSSLSPRFFSNEVGTILEVDELDDIKVLTPQSIAGDTFSYAEQLKNSAYETSGVSRLAAGAKLPSGIDRASGKALREYHDLESERFASLTLSWETFHKDLGELILKEINRCELSYVVESYSRNSPLTMIEFTDLSLDIDNLVVQIFGVPDLPSTPAGRIQLAEELTVSEYLTPEEASDLVNVPDIDSLLELKQAPRKACEKVVSRLMNEKDYFPEVDKFMDLGYLQDLLVLHYNNVIANYDDEDAETERLLNKIKKILVTVERLAPQPPPAPEAGGEEAMMMEAMMGGGGGSEMNLM